MIQEEIWMRLALLSERGNCHTTKYEHRSREQQNFSNLCHNMSWYDWSQGQYGMASDLAEAALKVRREFLGHTDSATLDSLVMLALVLSDQGKYEAAEEMNRRALEGREKVLG